MRTLELELAFLSWVPSFQDVKCRTHCPLENPIPFPKPLSRLVLVQNFLQIFAYEKTILKGSGVDRDPSVEQESQGGMNIALNISLFTFRLMRLCWITPISVGPDSSSAPSACL